ncbi:plexin-B-like [Ptychodera flava]|uniref:plexin-B-like n=1 Tax=Ptychodera flava TaxID=63121 RepID=UPI003969DDBF
MTLRCRHNSYNLAQAAYITRPAQDLSQSLALDDDEEVLFIAFAVGVNTPPTPTTKSAICMYKMSAIERAFQDAVEGCMINDGPSVQERYTASWMRGATCIGSLHEARVLQGLAPYTFHALRLRDNFSREIHECFAVTNNTYANGVDDQHGYDVEDYTDTLVTSIAVTTVQQHTVGFLGTGTGTILKVHFINSICANTYEEIKFKDSTKPILQDMVFDLDEKHFYTFTDDIVRKVKVEQCSQYITHSDCVRSRDPYCGWCAFNRSCSTYARCTVSDPPPYWPNVFENVTCAIIKSIEPEDGTPIDVSSKITLHVVRLPDIGDGESYSCAFDGYVTTAVNEGQTLTCDTPPIDNRPAIPLGEDHATVVLHIRIEMTDLTNEDFHYYDCSRHDSCSRCVTSNWACNWCVYENRCVYYLASCPTDDTSSIVVGSNNNFNNTDIKGRSFCPQLAEQTGKVLIPVDIDTEIQLSTMNIHHHKDLGGYECVMTIENTPLSIGASRNNENLVTCNARKFTYQTNQQEIPVNLALQWNNGKTVVEDIHGYTVTLYKCYVGRHNCRECLSNITTINPLNCGWCKCGNKCEYVEHCESDCFETDETKCLSVGSTRTCAVVWTAFIVWLSYCIINTTQE